MCASGVCGDNRENTHVHPIMFDASSAHTQMVRGVVNPNAPWHHNEAYCRPLKDIMPGFYHATSPPLTGPSQICLEGGDMCEADGHMDIDISLTGQ